MRHHTKAATHLQAHLWTLDPCRKPHVASFSWQMTHRLSSGMPLPPADNRQRLVLSRSLSANILNVSQHAEVAPCEYVRCKLHLNVGRIA